MNKLLYVKKCIFLFASLLYIFVQAQESDFAIKTAQLPIAFSIVREDSIQDLEIIKRYFPEDEVAMMMVASGGCTAALLIAKAPLSELTLVDPNKAQLELTKFKIQLLMLPIKKRLEILGYLPMNIQERKNIMTGYMQALDIDKNIFGDVNAVVSSGLDYAGRYEKIFEQLRMHLSKYKTELEKLFSFTDISEQVTYIAPSTTLGKALDKALDEVMSQKNLVTIFGEKATANRIQNFSRHFAQRIRLFLSKHLASSSPWLANMLLGHFHNNVLFPWLTTSFNAPLPTIQYFHGSMDAALEKAKPQSFHVIHLSNIIDWLTPREAKKTLELTYRALKPGGVVIIRQLNSNVNIVSLSKEFVWDIPASKEFLDNDRSFFYRNFLLGLKPRKPSAPKVQEAADTILAETPIIKGKFFQDLATMHKNIFKIAQAQFFFAVDYFSRPMAALVARLPLHKDRIDIIHNIVEEHGNFSKESYHSNTFKKFLSSLGITNKYMENLKPSPVVNMFTYTLMGVSANEDPLIAIACNGIIEYAFADISALIAQRVVERGWVKKEHLVHYNLHANIDKEHAEEFFKIIEPYMNDSKSRNHIISGLQLGAYIFNRLYEDLYAQAKVAINKNR